MAESYWYPSLEDVVKIHEDVVAEYPDTPGGVADQGDLEFALDYIETGAYGAVPETIHEKAFHLLRLLVANHPFVDAIKRTALNTTYVFYFLNGYRFTYDDEIRSILKQFATDEAAVEQSEVVGYLDTHTAAIDLQGELEHWREDLVERGLSAVTDDSTDPND